MFTSILRIKRKQTSDRIIYGVKMKYSSIKIILTFLVSMNIFLTNNFLTAQVLEQDSLALIALYDSTDGANWTNNENWLNTLIAEWSHVGV